MQIGKNSIVSMRYIMKNSRGEVLENTMDGDPVNYLHGSTAIESLLQAQLEGLQRGEKKTVHLPASSGFTSEDFFFEVLIDNIAIASAEEIVLGYPVKTSVEKCEAGCACYDKEKTGHL